MGKFTPKLGLHGDIGVLKWEKDAGQGVLQYRWSLIEFGHMSTPG